MPTDTAPLSPLDEAQIQRALALAESSFGLTEPNPRVGCVIGQVDGRVLGEGATQEAGGPHAEVMALRAAAARGMDTAGATAWVTLEPCAHHGRTPPCADALVAAKLARVVVACRDPFAQVNGRGLERLRAAGVQVDVAAGPLAAAAREINIGFFSRIERGRPWVRMKIAASLDGVTALHNGVSQWITGEEARTDGHRWRRRASAVLTGIGTVLCDDPRLDVRAVPTARQPRRIVVDSHLRIPPHARILATESSATTVFASHDTGQRAAALQAAGVQVQLCPDPGNHRVDLRTMLTRLSVEGVNELHVEAGATLNGALLQQGLVDELLLYMAPTLLGSGRGLVQLPPMNSLTERLDFALTEAAPCGRDLRLRVRVVPEVTA
jgi:diaminohydroxyphosphoribosylaminopyrimidine deaminase/5-amino-6-(5-phosphoribosylamino)uracil reductase